MTDFIQDITCDFVKELTPYESARRLFSGGRYWLNANESPFANDYSLDTSLLNRYPDCQPSELIGAYAGYANLEPSQVLASRGADEGIELLIRAFCNPGQDNIVICPPTYGMYAISGNTFNVAVNKVPLTSDFTLDIDTLTEIAHSEDLPKLLFLCSPNNPTGTLLPKAQVKQVLELFAGKTIVVMDEAYIEFSPRESWQTELQNFDNLVILRTLSKAFALAGIRCGFTLASEQIIKVLLKVIAPYPVSAPVAQIAQQALSPDGLNVMAEQVAYLSAEKQWLGEQLQARNYEIVGADGANFILFRAQQKDAVMQYLVDQGLLIRDQSKQVQLQNCLRVTVGDREQNQLFINLLDEYNNRNV